MTVASPMPGVLESLIATYGDVHVMPTSFAQRRFWLLDQMDEEASAYTMPIALRLSGAFDVERFARALRGVVARHEALRTVFAMQGDEPVQVVLPSMHVDVPVVDCAPLSEAQWQGELQRCVGQNANSAFDLARGPLLRATVLRRTREEHVLLLALHHIVADGWSVGVLYSELERLYASDGDTTGLPALSLQYPDYAVWQQRNAESAGMRRQLAYWAERLANPPTLALPTDRPRPAIQSMAGAKRQRIVAPAIVAGVRELARRESVTPTTAFLAAFTVLLHRWSGQRDLVLGTITSGRSRPELEPLIGLFVNTLAVRVEVEGSESFRSLLARVRDSATSAFANQDVPFERVVDAVQPTRDTSRSPIFQAAFQLLEGIQRNLALPGIAAAPIPVAKDTSKFDLTLMLHAHADGSLRAVMEHGTDLFDEATIDRMLAQYERCLESVVGAGECPVDRLQILPDSESRTLLVDWNATDDASIPESSLASLIAAQARRAPHAIAIEADSIDGPAESLTFEMLDQRATALAATLRSMGVRPSVGVAVAMERSCDLMVALVGVLFAGGHYVPLDPDYPDERLQYMLDDSAATVILTERAQRERFDAAAVTRHVLLREEGWTAAAAPSAPGDAAQVEIGAEDLAYVIYTSGSTGKPKGVAIPNRAVVNYLEWMRGAYAIGEGDTLLQKAPVSFDASIWELFLPLVSGARLVLARPGGQHDPAYLVDVIRRHGVTVVQLVPSQLRMLLEDDAMARCDSLRRVVCGGEALPGSLLTRLDATLPRVAISNVYGPTETTVYCTHWEFDRPGYDGTPRIGTPIANTQTYVVDAHLQPVPIGVAGELLIGGRGVSRGYLNRPELTSDRFVDDPFRPDGRLYRTGDLARWRNDGTLEYLGRIDTQVKLRGFRIELGEVEAALVAIPGVRAAVAVVREDAFGDARLVAYVVFDAPASPSLSEIRGAVAARLPEFMVPTTIVPIDTIPLNANGKVDRGALPMPDAMALPIGSAVAPRTELESQIADVWAAVLGRTDVGVTDDFFALGGHSLLAMRAIARLATVVPVRLTIGSLFEARTIERLAARIEERLAETGRSSADDEIVPRATGTDAPLSFAQELLWIHEQMTPGRAAYNVPIVRRVRGALDVARLQSAVDAVVARHESLRTIFVESHGEVSQRVLESMPVRIDVLPLLDSHRSGRDEDALRVLAERAGLPFDLASGPLARIVFVPLGDRESLLMFVFHHLVFDGGSIGVLLRDLDAAYAQADGAGALPPLRVHLADIASWERRTATERPENDGLAFWRATLAGATLRAGLPTDIPRSDAPSGPAARTAVTLPRSTRDGVRRLARETGTTPFMVLLAAVETLVARYTGRDDIVLGTPMARRTRSETQDVIGHLARTIPMRLALGGDPTFGELLQRARTASIAAFRHQDAPYEPLLAELRAESETAAATFDVLFVLQDPDPARTQIADLTLEPVGLAVGDAKAELVISLAEVADGLRAAVEYRADLFEPATIQRLLSHLGTLVSAATSDPATPLSRLPLMAATEREQVVREFNATERDFGAPTTLVEMLEAQALRTPDAVAVIDAQESIDYRTLHRRADDLATLLRARGVELGSLVALVAERSVEMVVALVAILRAGGAYVPIDPEYPAERVRFMLDDSGAGVVLAQRHVATLVPDAPGRSIIVLGDEHSVADAVGAALPTHAPRGDDPAYMIYTSGSTGRPKGALNAHGAIANRLQWMQAAYRLTAADAVLQKTPASFDVSVWEFFWPLVTGARLVMAPPGDHRDPRAVAELIARHRITVCHFVPSMLRAFVAEASATRCTSLRDVIASGEALPADLVAAFQRVLPTTRLHNLYGPTECAVDVSAWTCPPTIDPRAVVPIGAPIANTQLYVLDAARDPLPIGVPGELYIGGVQVGMGYHGRPDLTAERFVPDPFCRVPGRRLYRTGDVARWRDDGTVEYLGRVDDQVKVRGFRIELGEIEAAVTAFPGVRHAVAAVQRDSSGVAIVNAFIVPEVGADVDRAAMGEWLRARLPIHMVPAHVGTIDSVPLSPSGKVDRRALPTLGAEDVLAATTFVPPHGPVETVVALIFREVARAETVGAETSFFDVGGHSLLAARVLALAARLFQQQLTLRMLFQAPTVAAFAATIIAGEPSPGRAARIAELFLASRGGADAGAPAGRTATEERA